MKRAVRCAIAVGAALVAHTVAAHLLAGRDVVLAVLAGERGPTVALIAVLFAARLFLYLLAPGWVLHVAATVLLERRAARGARLTPHRDP